MTYPPQDYYNSPEELRRDITLLFCLNFFTLAALVILIIVLKSGAIV